MKTPSKSKKIVPAQSTKSTFPASTAQRHSDVASEPLSTPQRRVTRVAARVDVGFGNSIFIRGQGEGLSWDRGIPLQCEAANRWVWATQPANDLIVFKLLLNDQVWALGEDQTVEPGRTLEVRPVF